MTETVTIVHSSPMGEIVVPTTDGRAFAARRGVPVAVPADLAGHVPGAWQPLPDGEAPSLDDGRSWRCVDGVWSVREPGAGLLAQEDLWARADGADTDPDDDVTEI